MTRISRKSLGTDAPEFMVVARSVSFDDRDWAAEPRRDWGDFGLTLLAPKGDLQPENAWLVLARESESQRIVRQDGLFTVHAPPNRSRETVAEKRIATPERILIASTYRRRLLAELAFDGVSSASLFPDLDGLAAALNWAVGSGHSSDWRFFSSRFHGMLELRPERRSVYASSDEPRGLFAKCLLNPTASGRDTVPVDSGRGVSGGRGSG